MGSRCPPGVDRLVFGLIGRRCFGGRGELRSPLSPHRNAPSGHSGVAHGLFYDQAILWLDLQNAHAPGSLRSPSDAAPECFFKTSRCSARLIFRFRTDPPSVRRCSARLIRQAETLELQPRSRPPSSHTMAFAPKRSTSRFAPLTLRCRTEMFFQNFPVFRSAYSASRNARAPAASRPSVGGGSFAPPCTPLSRRPPDTGQTASKAPLEGSWRAAPEGWVRHGDAQFCGIEERRFRLRLTGLHAFCRRQRLWNQSVWPSRTCRAKALMSEKAGQSRPAPPASPRSCTSEPAVMSK